MPNSAPSTIQSAVLGKCPRCGKGSLFSGYLGVAPRCSSCGLDYASFDPGDGPAVFVILFAGFIVCGGALITEVKYSPPYWVHAVIWLPLIAILVLGGLRLMKSILLVLQYRHRSGEGRLME
ncbi:MAG TPA: DUF983 domain-containing protein [Rhizomicrobium sp.]|nr:DUF983 domain-containing protein [Rhizomicrobium sp.]